MGTESELFRAPSPNSSSTCSASESLQLLDHAVGGELDARAFLELAAVRVDVLHVAARVHLDGEAHEAAAGAARRAHRRLGALGAGRAGDVARCAGGGAAAHR